MKDSHTTPLSEDDAYAELTARLERDLLHRNHFLLMRTAEFRIQKLRKRLKSGLVEDKEEELELLNRQALLFQRLSEVMSPADPPGDLWKTALDKARAELDKFNNRDK